MFVNVFTSKKFTSLFKLNYQKYYVLSIIITMANNKQFKLCSK